MLDELPERRRDVALRRALDFDDRLDLGMVALGFAARERRGHAPLVLGKEKTNKKKVVAARPVSSSFGSLSLFFSVALLSFSLSLFLCLPLSLSREERDD